MTTYLGDMLLVRLVEGVVASGWSGGFWGTVVVAGIFGFGQLAYSVIAAVRPRLPESAAIVAGVGLTLAILLLPGTVRFWTPILAAAAVGLAASLYARAWRQRSRLAARIGALEGHVLMLDQEGRGLGIRPTYLAPWLPVPRFAPRDRAAHAADIERILERIRYPERADGSERPYERVLFFVHGGLNDYQNALLLSEERLRAMREEQERIYPIFVLWRSGLVPCYWAHLTEFQNGRTPRTSWLGRTLLVIVNFFWDVGRGISRFPRTLYYQLRSDRTLIDPGFEHDATNVPTLYRLLRILFLRSHEPAIRLKKKGDEREDDQDVWLSGDLRLTFELLNPLKMAVRYAVWPLIDALGTSAWKIMLRRTHTLFRSPYEFDALAARQRQDRGRHPYAPEPHHPEGTSLFRQMLDTDASGGLASFLRAFTEARRSEEGGIPERITLVGHSAGTIVLNNWLRLFPEFGATELVYLAAACGIDDALDAVQPVLERSSATFHVLCLHAKAERSEQHLFGLAPLGSLLEWIDNFFGTPLTFDQRTLGKWDNILQATHLIRRELRPRVHLKAFSIRSDATDLTPGEIEACRIGLPRWRGLDGRAILGREGWRSEEVRPPIAHGEFTACRFWRPAFYWVEERGSAPGPAD